MLHTLFICLNLFFLWIVWRIRRSKIIEIIMVGRSVTTDWNNNNCFLGWSVHVWNNTSKKLLCSKALQFMFFLKNEIMLYTYPILTPYRLTVVYCYNLFFWRNQIQCSLLIAQWHLFNVFILCVISTVFANK